MTKTDNERVIRQLYEITSRHERGFPEQTRELLRLGCHRLDLEIGILAEIDGDRYRVVHQVCPDDVPLEDEVRFSLPDTYCAVTIEANEPVAYAHVGKSELSNHPAYAAFQLESYIGIPIVVDGEVFGTLNFSSPIPRKRMFSEIDIDALKLMAIWIEGELSRQRQQEKILQQARELQKKNEVLLKMARTDCLTGIANRSSFFEELNHHLKLAYRLDIPVSVVMFDIDYFKSYNDTYGHVAGDNALRKIATAVAQLARDTDFVARYGGEEFIVMLAGSDRESAIMAAERLRGAIVEIDTLHRKVSGSFGITTHYPESGREIEPETLAERLVEEADKALYISKSAGRNCVNHYAEVASLLTQAASG